MTKYQVKISIEINVSAKNHHEIVAAVAKHIESTPVAELVNTSIISY